MEKLFLSVLKMSLISCYVIIFVLVVRFLLRKMPKTFSYVLWAIVFIKLICPFTFESVVSFIPVQVSIQTIKNAVLPDTVVDTEQTPTESFDTNTASDIVTASKTNQEPSAIFYLSLIWLTGIIVVITYSMNSYIKLKKRLATAIKVKNNLYEAPEIHTPFVIGMLRPKIYLPIELTKEESVYIIQHERIHIQRRDYLIKIFAFFISCMHWYNPLVWLSFILMNRDMEMSCDELVITKLGSDIKKEYSNSLLSLAVNRNMSSGIPIAFGEENVKSRIRNVLDYKKPTLWILAVSAVLVIVVCVGLFFNPSSSNNNFKEKLQPVELKTDKSEQGTYKLDSDITDFITSEVTEFDENGEAEETIITPVTEESTKVDNSTELIDTIVEDVADENIKEYLNSPNGKILKETTDSFVKAYFSCDKEIIEKYSAEDVKFDNNVYKDNNGDEKEVYNNLTHLLAKWYGASDETANVQYEYYIEGEGDESYTYLGINLLYSGDEWVVTDYYLEK